MEIGKLSSLPIIPLQAIQGNNYDFTLQPEIILNRSNAHSNGEEKKNEDQSKVETHSQLFRREILPWELSFPAKRGHFLDNNKKKKNEKEREVAISLDCRSTSNSSKRKTTNPRVTVATELRGTCIFDRFHWHVSGRAILDYSFGLNPIPPLESRTRLDRFLGQTRTHR